MKKEQDDGKLSEEDKKYINSLSYEDLLKHLRRAPIGDRWFKGERGKYWITRMNGLRSKPGGQEEHVRISKSIG
jgi:hypothetical protein